ncbi:protein NDR1-like [Chenopodium quinoa]|uniref:protein NDR1-like n=1 Tax=Chenopodium quinoa TaxID=63459 RepID=UPI000B774C03|nr:protein NDR1-like [Chenopodium quinoa]
MEAEEGSCCRCCCSFIFTLGLTALFMWLNLKPSNPVYSIENFDVFALNKTANNSIYYKNNHTIRYDFKLNNKENKDKGVYYDALNLTFYYFDALNLSLANKTLLGNDTITPFYQGHGKNTHRIRTIDARGVKWENATATTSFFRVELNTTVRFKIVFWKTKRRHRFGLFADLHVDEQGILIKRKKKGVKFRSGARNSKCCNFHFLGILGILTFILLW